MDKIEQEVKDSIDLENSDSILKEVTTEQKILPNEPSKVLKLPRGLTRQQAIELLNNANCGD